MFRSPHYASRTVLLLLLLVGRLPTSTRAALKIWQPQTAINPSTWRQVGSDRACAARTLVFQAAGHIEWLAGLTNTGPPIQRLVLPRDGMFLLNASDPAAPFRLGAAATGDICNADKSYLLQPAVQPPYWFDPSAWRTAGAPNAAQPPVNRVPCECDTVRLVADDRSPTTMAIRLHDNDEIVVRDVQLDNGLERTSMERFLGSRNGQLLFTSTGTTAERLARCTGGQRTCGCHAAERLQAVEEAVCSTVQCAPETQCLDPIVVAGWCCPLCGAQLLMAETTECPLRGDEKRGYEVYRMLGELEGGRWLKLVEFDWSVVPVVREDGAVAYRGQLMLVDRGDEYGGYSAELAANLMRLKGKLGESNGAIFLT